MKLLTTSYIPKEILEYLAYAKGGVGVGGGSPSHVPALYPTVGGGASLRGVLVRGRVPTTIQDRPSDTVWYMGTGPSCTWARLDAGQEKEIAGRSRG